MKDVLQFLRELAKNNNREWFEANKDRYLESRKKVLFITDVIINEIRVFDKDLPLVDPKDCMFRIFRDVRFSNDKRPYKTNFGSFISNGGRKGDKAGYYFHIEPGASFAGGGIYMPAAEPLRAVREHMARNAETFLDITNQPGFKTVYPDMYDHRLKTAPKGFPKDHEYIQLLRYKSFVFSTALSDNDIATGKFIEKAVAAFKQLYPVNAFLNEGLIDL